MKKEMERKEMKKDMKKDGMHKKEIMSEKKRDGKVEKHKGTKRTMSSKDCY